MLPRGTPARQRCRAAPTAISLSPGKSRPACAGIWFFGVHATRAEPGNGGRGASMQDRAAEQAGRTPGSEHEASPPASSPGPSTHVHATPFLAFSSATFSFAALILGVCRQARMAQDTAPGARGKHVVVVGGGMAGLAVRLPTPTSAAAAASDQSCTPSSVPATD